MKLPASLHSIAGAEAFACGNELITFETEDGGIDLKLVEMQLCAMVEHYADTM